VNCMELNGIVGTLMAIDVYLPSELSLRVYVEPYATAHETMLLVRKALRARDLPVEWTLYEIEQPSVNIIIVAVTIVIELVFRRLRELPTTTRCRPMHISSKLSSRCTPASPTRCVVANWHRHCAFFVFVLV
jgi:hypothetical protein